MIRTCIYRAYPFSLWRCNLRKLCSIIRFVLYFIPRRHASSSFRYLSSRAHFGKWSVCMSTSLYNRINTFLSMLDSGGAGRRFLVEGSHCWWRHGMITKRNLYEKRNKTKHAWRQLSRSSFTEARQGPLFWALDTKEMEKSFFGGRRR